MKTCKAEDLLGLSVHSLPDPLARRRTVARSGQLKLLALVLLCSLPGLIAYLAYQVVRPHGEAAIGRLITPVRPLPDAQAFTLDGRPIALSTLKGQWLLLKTDGGDCGQDCQHQLMQLRQLRLMLGKDMDRVDWVLLIDDAAALDVRLAGHLQHDGATVLRVAPPVLRDWLGDGADVARTQTIFVVDPMGNLMMRFPARLDSAAAAKAKRDLLHLLRASMAWDAPGR